ncbi:polymorphic toxin type 17 domain-containing protein [Clostridium sporogenes]|uniref:polymorphic toxin type 17 domain-containing protein n=1 Tax=Clostridium sporogenes TaxID=1509 RepID=UPI0018C873D2|nr:polymorphic toxin type 17 domain-containing protein [Clostridium sporogenes]
MRNTSHSVVKHTRNFVNNHRRAIEITRNVVAIASIALIAIPLVAPVAIPAMAIAALGIVEVGLDLAVGDNTSAAAGLLCLFPMGKGFKYVTEIGGDAIKGGSKAKNLYKVSSKVMDSTVKTAKGVLKDVKLPIKGKIRFVPPEKWTASQPLSKIDGGYVDKFGNIWTKGPSRTAGQVFEWDVQLSKTGKNKLGWASRDGSHLNVSLDGKITHK